MSHYFISEQYKNEDGSGYAVGHNDSYILLDIVNPEGLQCRILLDPDQVDHLLHLLRAHARTVLSNIAWDRFAESVQDIK